VPRAIAAAASAAVAAAGAQDALTFPSSAERLAALDREQVGLVLGAVVRSLLEEAHPGGLTGEDMHDLLARCAAASVWFPAFDANVLLVLLAGSLGIHPDDDEPRPVSALEMGCHAPLLISTLLSRSPSSRLDAHLDAAFSEIARSETVEMP
jgi:hypothetical protein